MPANHVLLRRTTLTASATSVTLDLTGISGYTDLKICASIRGDGTSQYVRVAFNSDTTFGNYVERQFTGNGYGPTGGSYPPLIWEINRSGYTANTFANCEAYIPAFSGSRNKTYQARSHDENNAQEAYMNLCGGLWANTNPITTIGFTIDTGSNFVAGCSFSVYGIVDASTTPLTAPKADGGDIIKTDGTYWYHAFTGSGVFKPQLNLTCDYLIVAGGGGGGTSGGYEVPGGGGAGGLRYFSAQSLNGSVPYIVSVGAGGARDTNGQDSAFNGATSTGGGKGGAYVPPGGSGGSGGGAVGWGNRLLIGYGNTPATSPSQGNNGGEGSYQWSESGGGGGGGAGAVGGNAGFNTSGNGGVGSSTYSSWGSVTGTGHNVSGTYYYAGGGGGSYGYNGHAGGTGGYGGGGSGSGPNGGSGLYATGGGGAGGMSSSGGVAGAGGSGIIIIRYPV